MKSIIQLRTIIPSLFIGLTLLCSAGPKAFGVSPAPDGGYPGGNTAEGQTALLSLTSGSYNTAIGFLALRSNTIGSFNTAIGAGALLTTVSDNPNTAQGNTATGAAALLNNTAGFDNTATGAFALANNITGDHNTANGEESLLHNDTGFANTAVGSDALLNNNAGTFNTAVGFGAGDSVTNASHVIAIGTTGANVSNSCYIGSIAGQTVGAGGSTCYVDNAGKLGVFLSARRFKTDIAEMGTASDALLALRPVTFRYKPELDKTGIPQFGLVAEEVAKVNPDLVTHDAKGELSTVRYEAVNAMLLNEFLKEHRKVEEQDCRIQAQETTIAALKKQMETVVAHAKEQDLKIQKVSAQIEMNRPAPRVVADGR